MTSLSCKPESQKTQKSCSYLTILFFIIILAAGLRLACWLAEDITSQFTIELIQFAADIHHHSIFKDNTQEPLSPILIYLAHSIFFTNEPVGEILIPFSWDFSSFFIAEVMTICSVILCFLIGRKVHSVQAGLWASLFFAVQPYCVEYTVQGLSELPFIAFILACLYLAVATEKKNMWMIFLSAVFGCLALLTRKEGIAVLAAATLYFLVTPKLPLKTRIRNLLIFGLGVVISIAVFLQLGGSLNWFFAYLPESPVFTSVRNLFSSAHSTDEIRVAAFYLEKQFQFVLYPFLQWIKVSGFLPGILFLGFLLLRKRMARKEGRQSAVLIRNNPMVILLLCYLVTNFVIVLWQLSRNSLFEGRFYYSASVVIFPIAGMMLVELLNQISSIKHRRWITAVIVVLVIGVTSLKSISKTISGRRPEIPSACQWVKENTPEDALIFTNDSRLGFYSNRNWGHLTYPLFSRSVTISKMVIQPEKSWLMIYERIVNPEPFDNHFKYISVPNGSKPVVEKIFPRNKNRVVIYKIVSTVK